MLRPRRGALPRRHDPWRRRSVRPPARTSGQWHAATRRLSSPHL